MELDSGIIYAFAAARARARFLANQDLVLCGLEIAEAVFGALDNNVLLESTVYDGEKIAAGTEFARIEGPAAALLTGERTALNIMQRLSGVATLTKAFVDRVEGTGARIVDTRKTTPGLRLIEKYAVTIGGGFNHRFGLDDGVLITDNHIALAGGVKRAVELARKAVPHLMKIEVEVGSQSQLREAVAGRADVIMLSNMTVDEIRESTKLIKEQSAGTLIGVSGEINLENVRRFAECGVDLISAGAITHPAAAIDISLKIRPL
ncbi:MAG: carboxylating nicotinate-nucleotide diphosphorylase [Acidobacteria bacterium]|nr:MAG: carboxylating nicotinate-nucleotide diphosphorylase [Acidobacteriota bacterium]